MAQDIHPIISGNPINNGCITVLYENKRSSYLNTGPINEGLPNMATISGKYDTRFDDSDYYDV